jgi:hypothetical protein
MCTTSAPEAIPALEFGLQIRLGETAVPEFEFLAELEGEESKIHPEALQAVVRTPHTSNLKISQL